MKRLAAVLATAASAGALGPRTALAAPPGDAHALPCRPTIACTADIVVPGAFELETGALFRRLGTSRQFTFPFLAKLTLTPAVQLQAGSNGYTYATGAAAAEYVDDAELGAKLHLVDQGPIAPSISVSALVSIPTFRGQGYLRTYDALFVAYVTRDFGPVHADFNGGENYFRFDAPLHAALHQEWAALALSANLPPPFGVMAEVYYFTDAAPVASRDGGALFAVSLTPSPWLVFDAGGDVGMFPSTRAYSVFVGMTVVPVLLWRPDSLVAGAPLRPTALD